MQWAHMGLDSLVIAKCPAIGRLPVSWDRLGIPHTGQGEACVTVGTLCRSVWTLTCFQVEFRDME